MGFKGKKGGRGGGSGGRGGGSGGRGRGGGGGRGAGGGRKANQKRKREEAAQETPESTAYNKMTREQRQHLKEYGEVHPIHTQRDVAPSMEAETKLSAKMGKRQSRNKRNKKKGDESESDSESEDEGPDAYQLLLQSSKRAGLQRRKVMEAKRAQDEQERRISEKAMADEEDDSEDDNEASELSLTESEYAAKLAELGDGYEIVEKGKEGSDDDEQMDAAVSDEDEDDEDEDEDEDEADEDEDDDADDDDSEDEDEDDNEDDVEVKDESTNKKNKFDNNVQNPTGIGCTFKLRYDSNTESNHFKKVSEVIETLESKSSSNSSLPSSKKSKISLASVSNAKELSTTNFQIVSPSFGSAEYIQPRFGHNPPTPGSTHIPDAPLWNARLQKSISNTTMPAEQQELVNHFNTYRDILFPLRSPSTSTIVRESYVLHCLNHVFKTRAKVLKNTDKLKTNVDLEFQDQGYTRPKVLILVPYKSNAMEIFKLIKKYSIDPSRKVEIRNEERFTSEFSHEQEDDEPQHPNPDHRHYFDGNVDDCFRVGVSVTRTTINLYSEFYKSDIIIASPLGLRLVIGAEGEEERDFDFLSSIEVLVIDQAESMLMQNWSHLEQLLKLINLTPTQTRDIDFSRVRKWSLNGWAKFYRQTIITSAFNSPDVNFLVKSLTHNYMGRVAFSKPQLGEISRITVEIPQAFHRVDCNSLVTSADQRFDFLIKSVLPEFSPQSRKSILIYVSDYFDFVRLRNHFRKKDLDFGQICEYTTKSNVSRARSDLFHSKRKFFLYTGRFHYHFRPRLRGIQHIIFYQLPEFPQFYPELVSSLNPSEETSCCALYTKYDSLRLQRIVGTDRATRMLSAQTKVHLFA